MASKVITDPKRPITKGEGTRGEIIEQDYPVPTYADKDKKEDAEPVSILKMPDNALLGSIAQGMLYLLSGEIGFFFLVLAFQKLTLPEVRELFQMIFIPTLVLLSAVTGFYYGNSKHAQ